MPVRQQVIGVVGSNVLYAPYVETGTKPHWPPISAVETWARRHGMNPYLVARAISRKGTKPIRYLESAFAANENKIILLLERTVKGIIET